MAERFKSDLPYGHFGRSNYSLNKHTWEHLRRIAPPSRIKPIGELKPLDVASSHPRIHPPAPDHGAKLRKRHEQQINALLSSNPELHMTAGLLSSHIRSSELVQNAVLRHDSSKGSLISVSNIHSKARHRSIRVAAYVTGEDGSDLCFVRMQMQKQWWIENDDVWLEVPTMHGERRILPGKGSPILQVRFHSSVEPGSAMLGLRTQDKVAIFHPTHEKASSEAASGSRLVLDPLYNVDVDQPDGAPYVDFTFNPWFSQQLALVDQGGHWKVLEFRTRKMDHVARQWAGSSVNDNTALTDGWARVAWVMNIEVVAICTRTTLKLINISADQAIVVEHVSVELSGPVPWILDFAIVPEHPDKFIVLTTTHILLYKANDEPSGGTITSLLMKVRHFRGPEDTTLNLKTWNEGDGVVVAMQSSIMTRIICYRIDLRVGSRAVLGDPFELVLPSTPEGHGVHDRVSDIYIQPVKMVQRLGARAVKSTLTTHHFLAASIVSGHSGAFECLLRTFASGQHATDQLLLPPDRSKKLNVTSSQLEPSYFVVDDATVELEEEPSRRREPLARRRRRPKPRLPPTERTIDLEKVTRLLQESVGGSQPFDEALDSVTQSLKAWRAGDAAPLETLTGFLNAELSIDDIHDSSETFQALFQPHFHEWLDSLATDDEPAQHSQQRLALRALTLPVVLNLGAKLTQPDLSAVYDEVVNCWITSLPASVPGRVRLAKARMASSIAADLILACNVLRVEETEPKLEPAGQDPESQTQEPWSSQPTFSQQTSALPTPSITPSITTASSHPSSFAAPELLRLSKYTTFSKPVPTILPRSLRRVLAHWKPGAQPDDYDWLSTSRNLTQKDNEEEDEGMPERERKRLQRRADRHIRRQRKEAAASEAMQLASSQAPAIFSASQPMAVQVESQPSAVAQSSQMTIRGGPYAGATSQVVAGRFGGRPPAKKKRKQGF